MQFHHVAVEFQKIEETSSRTAMTERLAALLGDCTPHEARIIANLSLGQLRPSYVGTQFNIAQKSFVQVAARAGDATLSDIQTMMKNEGDIGTVIQRLEVGHNTHITLEQVYNELVSLEVLGGAGSQELRIEKIIELLKRLDPLDAKYVVRIIMGTLRLGFSDMTLIDALSWMEVGSKKLRTRIEHAYTLCADPGLIAYTIKNEGIDGLNELSITVGIPVRPAAAERLPDAKAIVEKLGDCVAQPKLDGFRLQIHIKSTQDKTDVHFFSRNLIDMSPMFPDLVKALSGLTVTSSCSKKPEADFCHEPDMPVREIICEGEAIVFDPNTGGFVPFQETVKRKRKHGIESAAQEFPLKVFIFDLLYLNGKSYLDKGHETRRAMLARIFPQDPEATISLIEEQPIHSAQELENYFESNVAAGLEGLVVKKPQAPYAPGKRNFSWIKLKRQTCGHLEDTLDLVVLGYYFGAGKRAGFGIGALLAGAYNPEKDVFQTVAKIGTGMTDKEWVELKERCDALERDHRPANVEVAKELEPDVWAYPELVVMVGADEITQSPLHTAHKVGKGTGLALRFPRFMGYRPDKSALQATTVDEVKRLFQDQGAGSSVQTESSK